MKLRRQLMFAIIFAFLLAQTAMSGECPMGPHGGPEFEAAWPDDGYYDPNTGKPRSAPAPVMGWLKDMQKKGTLSKCDMAELEALENILADIRAEKDAFHKQSLQTYEEEEGCFPSLWQACTCGRPKRPRMPSAAGEAMEPNDVKGKKPRKPKKNLATENPFYEI